MIEVDERFEVAAAPDIVWRLLADPHAVVSCVPGAAIDSDNEDGSMEATLSIKFGPVGVAFQAHAEVEYDQVARTGRVSARGRDKQGGARFRATSAFDVTESAAGSLVTTRGEVEISGKLASMIESGAGVVVKRMSAQFAECLRARCTSDTEC